ncbi:MAG: glycoside hydrolase family 127 protein, partial [Planctomycetota bacterium]
HPNGYINPHFTLDGPEDRWRNLRDGHELYCGGHHIEAAVAYFEGTGKRRYLDVMCRYAEHIGTVFGTEEGKKRGYPGHEEMELALVKLYRATGERRYLALSKYFIDERGAEPHYFDVEAAARGEDPKSFGFGDYSYNQSHKPVREQTDAVGHSVRACYLYAGMADVAAETDDKELLAACRRLWRSIVEGRMYLIGGVGSASSGERFSRDYDLPNETAYAETCANIALVFFAHRMLHADGDAEYADVMERALYNGVLSGVALDGRHFFYANPLASVPGVNPDNPRRPIGGHYARSEWFGCPCCPPNIARLVASIGGYVYSQGEREARVNLYVAGSAELDLAGRPRRVSSLKEPDATRKVALEVKTGYPWQEKVRIAVAPEGPERFTLSLRLPGWCRKPALKVNGKGVALSKITRKGFARLDRKWKKGDKVELVLPMPVERIEAHPHVRQDAGRIALQRGPVVYCLEEVDNGPGLADVMIPRSAKLTARPAKKLLGGTVVITGRAKRRDLKGWKGRLYGAERSRLRDFTFKAVPYALWANRSPGEMVVWVLSGS